MIFRFGDYKPDLTPKSIVGIENKEISELLASNL